MFCPKCGNKVENNPKFCNKCGYKLERTENINVNVAQPVINTNQSIPIITQQPVINQPQPVINNLTPPVEKDSKKMIFMGIGAGTMGLIILILLVVIINLCTNNYYFSDSNYEENEVSEENSTQKNTKRGKYTTVIITDNTYEGVKIRKEADAYNLISEDSTKQKVNCPKEIKKIEEELIKDYSITAVNLCELDVDFAREIVNVFKVVYEEYPMAREGLTNLSLINGNLEENYIAAFLPIFTFATSDGLSQYPWVMKTQIFLNTTYFLNDERLSSSVKTASETGHFPKNATRYSPVAHELAHYLSFLAVMENKKMDSILLVDSKNETTFYEVYDNYGYGKYSLEMIKEAYERYKKDTNDNIALDDWRATISNYAVAKDNNGEYIYDETIAEAFHDVYLNKDNATAASKYVVSVLKEKLGG